MKPLHLFLWLICLASCLTFALAGFLGWHPPTVACIALVLASGGAGWLVSGSGTRADW